MALALSSLRTPGVYVDEVSLLPPSVAAVETAIPVFIAHTQTAKDDLGRDVATWPATPYVKRITSMLEYEQYFGTALSQTIAATVTADQMGSVQISALVYNMHYAIRHYFSNGGGPCYICSVGNFVAAPSVAAYTRGITAIENADEPTLILFPDAVNLAQGTDYYDVLTAALSQCNVRGDRFLLCDVYNGDKEANRDVHIAAFRDGIGSNHLKYAAAYYPWLQTSLPFHYEDQRVTFTHTGGILNNQKLIHIRAIIKADEEKIKAQNAAALAAAVPTTAPEAKDFALRAARAAIVAANTVRDAALLDLVAAPELAAANAAAVLAQTALTDATAVNIVDVGAKAAAVAAATSAVAAADAAIQAAIIDHLTLADVKRVFTAAFDARLRQLINEQRAVLPASAAIAGVYVMVDNSRGVWKAPANVSLNQIIKPMVMINDEIQRNLNVDDTTGKSINAIRNFTGKGTLVWGARTLDAFSDEWRYVNVRRLFNMVEESLKKSSSQFVFEPNDANLWIKVKAMTENFLTLLWRQGALAGAKPSDAFLVRVGMPDTMDANDVLNGRLIVEVLMAPVRPAEFIVLRFMHKLQVS